MFPRFNVRGRSDHISKVTGSNPSELTLGLERTAMPPLGGIWVFFLGLRAWQGKKKRGPTNDLYTALQLRH